MPAAWSGGARSCRSPLAETSHRFRAIVANNMNPTSPKTLAVSFTNFGPYHLARLRALASLMAEQGGRLIAYETAGIERRYPWLAERGKQPFEWITLFPGRELESLPDSACADAMRAALMRDKPEAVAVAGYVRPESLAALAWARRYSRPAVLMSESGR